MKRQYDFVKACEAYEVYKNQSLIRYGLAIGSGIAASLRHFIFSMNPLCFVWIPVVFFAKLTDMPKPVMPDDESFMYYVAE